MSKRTELTADEAREYLARGRARRDAGELCTPEAGCECGGTGYVERLYGRSHHDAGRVVGFCTCAVGRALARDEMLRLEKRGEQNLEVE